MTLAMFGGLVAMVLACVGCMNNRLKGQQDVLRASAPAHPHDQPALLSPVEHVARRNNGAAERNDRRQNHDEHPRMRDYGDALCPHLT
jgi:hypothetical protein